MQKKLYSNQFLMLDSKTKEDNILKLFIKLNFSILYNTITHF